MSCNAKHYLDLNKLASMMLVKRDTECKSLRDIEKIISVSASTLSRIENQKGIPDFDVVMAIREWLGVPLDDLLIDSQLNEAPFSFELEIIEKKLRELSDILSAIKRHSPTLAENCGDDCQSRW
jgi:transcriptional regulator with XRE-family HTH domain